MSNALDTVIANAATGMSAQSIRMNAISSNLANSSDVGNSDASTYHAKHVVFSEIKQQVLDGSSDDASGGVKVTSVIESQKPLQKNYDPDSPMSDENGFTYLTDVSPMQEMTDMIAASKEYQANVEVINTTKNMILQTLNVINTK